MAAATLTPYYNNTTQTTYNLVSTGPTGSMWKLAGRDLGQPKSVEIIRKMTPIGSSANDHVILRLSNTMRNATTGKLATLVATCDISLPKDATDLTTNQRLYMLAELASLLNDSSANAATTVARSALIEGRDL